ncbi:MAG: PocR ligand-binding domain-containing protein [Actinomycetia bacterium]|nr:PocR ligand-binding domain-containing protein [Actinomycetes bacterium]
MTGALLGQFIDLERVDPLQRAFADATELGAITVDNVGAPVVAAAHFSEFCKRMRANPATNRLCRLCDAHGSMQAAINQRAYVYRCHAGLVDISVALVVNGWYLGAILCGQALLSTRTGEPPPLIAEDTHWKANPTLRSLYDDIPRVSLSKVRGVADALFELSRDIAGTTPGRINQRPTVVPLAPPPAAVPEPEPDGQTRETIDAAVSMDLVGAIDAATGVLDRIWRAPLAQDRLAALRRFHEQLLGILGDVDSARSARRAEVALPQRLATDRWQAQLATESLLDAIVTALDHQGAAPWHVRLRNAVVRDVASNLDLGQAAASVGMSPSHLSRSFRRETGMTFADFKTAERLRRAQLLLSHTDTPIGDVAAMVGVAHPGYFTRLFRAHTGLTPGEWRRNSLTPDPSRAAARDRRPTPACPPP